MMTPAGYLSLSETDREKVKRARAACVGWLSSRCAPGCTNCVQWDHPPQRAAPTIPQRRSD